MFKSQYLLCQRLLLVLFACMLPALSCTQAWAFDRNHPELSIVFNEQTDADAAGLSALKDIVQDSDGYMWFGTENGLVRFDSKNKKFYFNDPLKPQSLASNYVTDLLIDKHNQLWVAGNQGVSLFQPKLDQFINYRNLEAHLNGMCSGMIWKMAEGKNGQLYIGSETGLSVIDPQHEAIRCLRHESNNSQSIPSGFVRAVYTDSQDRIWVGIFGKGLARYWPDEDRFEYAASDFFSSSSDAARHISDIAEGPEGYIWMTTYGGGALRLDPKTEKVRQYSHDIQAPRSLPSNVLESVHQDAYGNLWFASDHGGLVLYDKQHDNFRSYKSKVGAADGILSNQVRVVYDDSQGNLWVGFFPNGLSLLDLKPDVFNSFKHNPKNNKSLSSNAILSIFKDSEGELWVGTEEGLNRFNASSEKFKRYSYNPIDDSGLKANAVLSIAEQPAGTLWLGTWAGGLFKFDKQTEQFEQYLPKPGQKNSLSSPFVWSIASTPQGKLVIGTSEGGGLNFFDPKTENFQHFKANGGGLDLSHNHVWTLLVDSYGQIWVGTNNGLNLYDSMNQGFIKFLEGDDRLINKPVTSITALYEDRKHYIWAGTVNGQIYKINPTTREFEKIEGVPWQKNTRISAFLEDEQGQLWIATTVGIAQYDKSSGHFRMFTQSDGLAGAIHNRAAAFKDEKGVLYFGSTAGVNYFDPARVHKMGAAPKVKITGLKVNSRNVNFKSDPEILDVAIDHAEQLNLHYRHNMFSFSFVALSYKAAHKNHFKYKLEGFDQQWNDVGSSHIATYTNLNPGDYTFMVKGANSNELWSEPGASIQVHIARPPWKSLWAYLIYLLVACLLFGLLGYLNKRKQELQKQKEQYLKLQSLNRVKDTFLANTSHEIRTPLNGIVGLADNILSGATGEVSRETQNAVQMIGLSGQRLLALINDILDQSKLSSGLLKLDYSAVDLKSCVEGVFNLLRPLAQEKSIELLNQLDDDISPVKADDNRLQQILINLVGNAIKYSEGGSVKVKALVMESGVRISVVDSGPGIAEDDQAIIFESFAQLENNSTGGTGLGLAITRQLVELHGSDIKLQSQLGLGSNFSFKLVYASAELIEASKSKHSTLKNPPVYLLHSELVRIAGDKSPDAQANNSAGAAENTSISSVAQPAERNVHVHIARESMAAPDLASLNTLGKILVVDDDPVNRMVLTSMLAQKDFKFDEAKNGLEALELLEGSSDYCAVILDVMMPKLSGLDTCKRLRKMPGLEQLPVLFLSAKHQEDVQDEAEIAGGDAVLSKPVEKSVLFSSLVTLLNKPSAS